MWQAIETLQQELGSCKRKHAEERTASEKKHQAQLAEVEPNAAHFAIASLGHGGLLQHVVTQIQQPRKTGVVGRLVLKTSLGAAYVDEERYEDVQLDGDGVLELLGLGEVIIAHGALELHFAEHVRGRAARHMRTYSLRHALGDRPRRAWRVPLV